MTAEEALRRAAELGGETLNLQDVAVDKGYFQVHCSLGDEPKVNHTFGALRRSPSSSSGRRG